MNLRRVTFAFLVLVVSATAHAQGKGGTVHKGTKQEAKQAEATYAQCVYNQGGYIASVQWYAPGTLKSTKSGDTYTLTKTKPAYKTETISLGQKSCTGGKGSKNVAVLTIKGGQYARIAAIVATDIAAVGGTIGCAAGAVGLTVITAGAGAVAAAACEVLGDAAIGLVADPSVIPDAKELFAVVQPPATNGLKPKMIVMYGTVFDAKTKVAYPL